MTVQLTAKKPSDPNFIDSATDEAVYVIHGTYGNKQIRVPKDVPVVIEDTRANYGSFSSGGTNPRDHFPNIEVRDGALVIPIIDMIDNILARAEPEALAEALFSNAEVRERFMECLTRRYSSDDFTIQDRIKFLHAVKEQVHDQHLWNLQGSLVTLESEASRVAYNQYLQSTYKRYHAAVMETLRSLDGDAYHKVISLHGDNPFSGMEKEEGHFSTTGSHWTEAREYWRKATKQAFAFPPEPEDKDPLE